MGKSLVEPELIDQVLEIKEIISEKNGSVPLPEDVICAESVDQTIGAKRRSVGSIDSEEMILDIGPESAKKMGQLLKKAATIVWNGPVGVFETEQFSKGTRAIGEAIQESSAYTIAGGGDTISAINKFRISGIDYISTAGGAFLEFLEGRALPALEVLRNRKEN